MRHAEAGQIQPAAVIEIELGVLVNDGARVYGGAEVQAAGGNAADDPRLRRHGDVPQDLFFVGNGGHALRHAYA